MAKTILNEVIVTGTLEEVATEVKTDRNGKEYIGGKIVINCGEIDGKANLIDLRVFTYKMTKAGTPSKLFTSYASLESYLYKRITVTAELREDNMYSQNTGKMLFFNGIYVKFVNAARSTETDGATIRFRGFVVRSIYERKDKEDNLIGYRMEIAQQNYNATRAQVLRFDVAKEDVNIVNVISERYMVGSTVDISGIVTYLTTTRVVTEEVAFGEPTQRTYVNSEKMFRITGGNEPYDESNPEAYSNEDVHKLVDAYKTYCAEKLEAAKNATAEASAPADTQKTAMQSAIRTSSLI